MFTGIPPAWVAIQALFDSIRFVPVGPGKPETHRFPDRGNADTARSTSKNRMR
jgi:hypothetical protein